MLAVHYYRLVRHTVDCRFFFFKQKTAYEMRISDWSSDVCSSDLVVELTAGVQLGHDDLRRRDALFLVDVDRDAAAVVGHRYRAVLVDGHGDVVGVAGQGLVDRVVDHLEHHVVQAGTVVDVADVHARTLADGFQAAQHGNPAGIVDGALAALLGVLVGFGHSARDSHGDGRAGAETH